MRRAVFLCGVLCCAGAEAGERVALIVSNDTGLSDDAPLKYTSADADRIADVLTELGEFQRADVHRMSGKSAAEVLSKLDQLALASSRWKTFFFFYSGHADASALRMAGSTLPFDTMRQHLSAVKADLHVSILDACKSGGAARTKGVREAPAFDVRINDDAIEGTVFISSSAPDEQSYESEDARGAVFTSHWTAGLRGAADRDGDNQVTLGEAYSYAYSQTLRATLLSRAGPQHPTYYWNFSGKRDPVLTVLNTSAHLTIVSDVDARYVLFDAQERDVLAELPIERGDKRRVAVAPGEYVVKKRGANGLAVARVEITKGDDRILQGQQMKPVPFVRLARKGPLGGMWLTAAAGQYASALGPLGHLHFDLGVEWERGPWLLFGGLLVATGSETQAGLTTADTLVGLTGGALFSLRLGQVALRAGPLAGLAYVRQASFGQKPRQSLGALLTLRVRLDIDLVERFSLFALIDGGAQGIRLAARPERDGFSIGSFGVLAYASYSVGARFSW